jgi:outer membrane protein assembly factor BamB
VLAVVLAGLLAAPAARAAETSAVADRMNPAHSGSLDAAAPAPPLRLSWTRDLDSPDTLYPELSYPLIVDGRVFIVAARALQALSAETGATLWSVPLTVGAPAYDAGRVIVTTNGSVEAFDAATGQARWARTDLETSQCPAVAADGVVYTKSAWTAYALRVSDGTTLWSRPLPPGGICSATVGAGFVYYSSGSSTIALRRSDGTVAWTFGERGTSAPLALHGGRLWHADTQYSPALDAATGALAGGAFTWRVPAFAGDLAFISVGHNVRDAQARMLQAVDAATGALRWEFGAEHGIHTTPTAAAGTVYVADDRRGLYGLRASDGRLQWCTTMPDFPDRYSHVVAGEGRLLVVAGNSLTVYEPGGTPGCDYKRVARPGWYDPITPGAAATAPAPLRQSFESNRGQLPPGVRFAASAPGHELQVTASGARVTTADGELGIRPVGATGPRSTRGEQRQAGVINLIGARERHVRIRRYGRVRQRATWPGIDLVYRLSGAVLEYDVVVEPGADPSRARIALDGARDVRLDRDGALVARVGSGTVRQAPPVAFQGRRRLAARFVVHPDGTFSFAVRGRDPRRRLTIDPVLGVSGFIGGWLHDEATDVDVDPTGNVYVTGWTTSRDLAGANALFGWDEWNAMCQLDTCTDAFVAKYAPGGRSLVYLTLLSGNGDDRANAVAAGASGHAYVGGNTNSSDFPTRNAAQDRFGGGSSDGDAFVTKLAPDGSALEWSTYHGGGSSWGEIAHDIALDAAGSAYVTGHTDSTTFPTTASAADRVCTEDIYSPYCREAWVAKFTSTGGLAYSTYFGGEESGEHATGIAVDRAGRAVIAGSANGASDFPTTPGAYDSTPDPYFSESWAARLSSDGSAVQWATTFGGLDFDDGHAVALDAQDRPVVVGTTQSPDFPTTPGALDRQCTTSDEQYACTNQTDGYVTKLTSDGSGLVWSTFLGGAGYDDAHGVDVGPGGEVVIAGSASSEYAFPLRDAFQPVEAGGASCGSRSWCADAFLVRLSEAGGLLSGTLLGGQSHDVANGVALEPDGDAWIAGRAHSRNLPASEDAVQPAQAGGNCGGSWNEFPECSDGFLSEIRESAGAPPDPPPPDPPPDTTSGGTATPAQPSGAPGPRTAAPTLARRLTARRRGRLVTGHLRADGDVQACTSRVRIVVERRSGGAWRPVARTRTRLDGRFRITLPARRGAYRLRAPAAARGGASCASARSVIHDVTARPALATEGRVATTARRSSTMPVII